MRTDPLRNGVSAPLRALIVDDEALARRGLHLRLADIDDIEIVGECNNGREALASISSDAPDLVFLDLNMPGMDGQGVLRQLSGVNHSAEIVVVTANDTIQAAIEFMKLGAADYIT